jgi:hypothetical protein
MATAAQIAANQQNAQLSTGPTSPDGKTKISKNALKTGLTGHTVLLPTDDAALYEQHVEIFRKRFEPMGGEETELVQSIADTAWRIARIPSLEAGIFAIGRAKLAHLHAQEDDTTRRQLIEAEVYIAYERQLRGLATQEGRLRRQREKDELTLRTLQAKRRQERNARLNKAADLYIVAVDQDNHDEFELDQFGFEFSLEDIEVRAIERKPTLFNAYWEQQRSLEAQNAKAAA